MSLEVVPTRYGAAAVDALAAAVARAKDGEPLRPVTVVVPSNYAGVAARRALARRGGVIGVSFVTLYRLAELLGGVEHGAPWPGPHLLAGRGHRGARRAVRAPRVVRPGGRPTVDRGGAATGAPGAARPHGGRAGRARPGRRPGRGRGRDRPAADGPAVRPAGTTRPISWSRPRRSCAPRGRPAPRQGTSSGWSSTSLSRCRRPGAELLLALAGTASVTVLAGPDRRRGRSAPPGARTARRAARDAAARAGTPRRSRWRWQPMRTTRSGWRCGASSAPRRRASPSSG